MTQPDQPALDPCAESNSNKKRNDPGRCHSSDERARARGAGYYADSYGLSIWTCPRYLIQKYLWRFWWKQFKFGSKLIKLDSDQMEGADVLAELWSMIEAWNFLQLGDRVEITEHISAVESSGWIICIVESYVSSGAMDTLTKFSKFERQNRKLFIKKQFGSSKIVKFFFNYTFCGTRRMIHLRHFSLLAILTT